MHYKIPYHKPARPEPRSVQEVKGVASQQDVREFNSLASGGQGAFLKNRPWTPKKLFISAFHKPYQKLLRGDLGGSFLEKSTPR
jgi:hypothetical protein